MHYHCEVWVPKKDKWRSQVRATLESLVEGDNKDGFYDWFVIGGRWSGEHSSWLLTEKFGKETMKLIHDEFEKEFGWFTNSANDDTKRASQYEQVFRRHISKAEFSGLIPAWRNSYKEDGFDDDIIAITDVPWKQFTCYTFVLSARGKKFEELKKYWHSQIWNGSTHQDALYDVKKILEDHKIKDGYLVTVDYHC